MLTLDQVKLKSKARIVGLQQVIEAATVALIERCYARGVNVVITQGLRTYAEQDGLYAKGRTSQQLAAVGLSYVAAQPNEQVVTKARGGYSNHNFGWAIDFALLLPDGRSVSWDTLRDGDKDSLPDWSEVVEEAKKLGFEWGGDWRTFKDMPHLQMVFGLSTTQLRIGREPSKAQIAAAYAVIDKLQEEAEELSQAEKQELAALRSEVKELAAVVSGLSKSKVTERVSKLEDRASIKAPEWAQPAVKAAVNAGLIDTPEGGSQDFYRILTVLDRAGLLTTIHEGDK
ncbi:M15 family metallopeptidase [Paenibacillus sp. IHBB 3054]|uniref:M15 family metallopeptidase n=1 Tax=Paenibacillus sp. IHBB 3054 TaxID=3425689 RepID=UPI003F6719A3